MATIVNGCGTAEKWRRRDLGSLLTAFVDERPEVFDGPILNLHTKFKLISTNGGGEKECAMELKNRNSQKARLGPLLNVHTEFQLPSQIRSRVKRGANSKN